MANKSLKKITLIIISLIVFMLIARAIFYQKFETKNMFSESSNEYISTNLGIKFQKKWQDLTVIEQGNRIFTYHDQMSLPITDWSYMDYIAVFEKPEDEQIEDSIKNIIKQEGKNLENCQITKTINHWRHPEYETFIIGLSKPVTSYSETELEEIKQADIQAKEDGGPFNGEYQKRVISNKRRINLCSEYAAGNMRVPSMFLFKEEASKTKFIFLPGHNDAYFHLENSIEFLDNKTLF